MIASYESEEETPHPGTTGQSRFGGNGDHLAVVDVGLEAGQHEGGHVGTIDVVGGRLGIDEELPFRH